MKIDDKILEICARAIKAEYNRRKYCPEGTPTNNAFYEKPDKDPFEYLAEVCLTAYLKETQGWKPIETMPISEEVLAWHKEGKNWHQVKRVDYDHNLVKMRWANDYNQHLTDFECWKPLPTPPKE